MKKSIILAISAFVLFTNVINAQQLTELWTGLRQKQAEMPVGNAPAQVVERVPFKIIPTALKPVRSGEWIIGDGWTLVDNNSLILSGKSIFSTGDELYSGKCANAWYNATVPGTVLTTLVNQGVYPDPFYGLNNMAIPESLNKTDWWYRVEFDMPINVEHGRIYLLFNGINYRADIYMNGFFIGKTMGAFERGEFDVTTEARKEGGNIVAVHVYPPHNPGIPHEQTMAEGQGLNGGMLSLDGPTFISSMGWDWIPGIRDRNTGLWQDVRLRVGGPVRIGDPLVVTNIPLPDTTKAEIRVEVPITNVGCQRKKGTIKLLLSDLQLEVSADYTLNSGESKTIIFSPEFNKELMIDNPRLWWPNGYGEQNLYKLSISAETEKGESDAKSLTFGIRELSYELMVSDDSNTRIAYTPTDRYSADDHSTKEPLFDYINRVPLTKDNNLPVFASNDRSGVEILDKNDPVGPFFVIRVNGKRIFCRGGNWGMDDGMKRVTRERLEPYFQLHKDMNFNIIRNWTGESTEELFYQLCDEYGMLVWNDFWITTDDTVEPNDFALFMRNAKETVLRFRNHPSIAVWCPRNEGFAPAQMEPQLQQLMATEDPTRHYHGQSRFLNMGTSGPWGYFEDPAYYFAKRASGFNTEMGAFAIPTANTLKKFIAPEDRWPINDVWAYHDLHHKSQNFAGFMKAVAAYGEAGSLEDFSAKSQFVCYDAWRAMLEAWNSKMWNNTTGLILWMSHPAWPSMIWQTYTYDYETPGSYFGAKKACEPLHIQMNLPDNKVVIVNTTLKDYTDLTATAKYYDIKGKFLFSVNTHKSIKSVAKANSVTECFVPKVATELPFQYLVRLELRDARGAVVSLNDYWRTNSLKEAKLFADVAKASVTSKVRTTKDGTFVELKNNSKNIALGVKLNAVNSADGEYILPAFFSDGYINLLPGEKRLIKVDDISGDFTVEVSGYNI